MITIRDFIPPLVYKVLNYFKPIREREGGWKGNYSSWTEAKKQSIGYDADFIADTVIKTMSKVRDDESLFELDAILYKKRPGNYPLFFSLCWIALQEENRLRILDFGGSLGSSFFLIRGLISPYIAIDWNIIEQRHLTYAGKETFQVPGLTFFEDFASFHECKTADVLLLSGVLQCLEKHDFINEAIHRFKYTYIIIDRTPVFDSESSRTVITVQKLPDRFYGKAASFPCKIFRFEDIFESLSPFYETIISDNDFEKFTADFNNQSFSFKYVLLKLRKDV